MQGSNTFAFRFVLRIFVGLWAFLILAGQPVQAREGDGAATGLNVQASTDTPVLGLGIDLTAAQVDRVDPAPFDLTDQVIGLNAVSGAVTADVVTANTRHQPFQNQIDSSAATENLAILLDLLGIHLVDLSATSIDSNAQVTGSCGNFSASGGAAVEDLTLSVLGQAVAAGLTLSPAANTELLNTNINIPLVGSTVSAVALVILNEQTVAADQSDIAVNALRIRLDITVSGLINLSQVVEIVVSRSEAGFTSCEDVNLAVDKTTSLGPGVHATVGVPFDYTVTITETSNNADATAVQFTDTLPAEVTFLSFIDQDGGSCSHSAGVITCQWATVPAGGSVAVTYRVTPNTATDPASVSNAVTVVTGSNDTDPGDDSDSESVVIDPVGAVTTDLAVEFVAPTPADGTVGVPQTVNIRVTNNGAIATGSTLVYTVTPDISIDSFEPVVAAALGGCAINANTLNCGSADLADGFDQTLQVGITPTTPGANTHTATVSSTVSEVDLSNNTDQATVNVVAPPSDVVLQADVSDTPDPVTVGQVVTYTIDISNQGTSDANGVTLDANLGGVPVSVGSAVPTQGSCGLSGTQVTCNLGTLAAGGGSAQVVVIATPNGTGTLNLSGTAEDDAANTAPVTEDTLVTALTADLDITKSTAQAEVTVGQQITYVLEVTNNGPENAVNVVVSDALPAQVQFVSATPAQGLCAEAGGVVTCSLGALAAGNTAGITLVVRATAVGTASNTASVAADTNDPVIDNNTSDPVVTRILDGAAAIPALTGYGLYAFALILAFAGFSALRERSKARTR